MKKASKIMRARPLPGAPRPSWGPVFGAMVGKPKMSQNPKPTMGVPVTRARVAAGKGASTIGARMKAAYQKRSGKRGR